MLKRDANCTSMNTDIKIVIFKNFLIFYNMLSRIAKKIQMKFHIKYKKRVNLKSISYKIKRVLEIAISSSILPIHK